MTTFTIDGQLPIDVAQALIRLIGAAYPGTRIGNSTRGITFHIDPADRADDSVFARAAELKTAADEYTSDTCVIACDADGASMALDKHLVTHLAELSSALFEETGAENYLESAFTYGDGHYYATVCRSKGQSPAALRQAAETRATAAQAHSDNLAGLLRRAMAGEDVRAAAKALGV